MIQLHPFSRLSGAASAFVIASTLAMPVLAQQVPPVAAGATAPDEVSATPDVAEAASTGDIIVTAQKRSERLQEA